MYGSKVRIFTKCYIKGPEDFSDVNINLVELWLVYWYL